MKILFIEQEIVNARRIFFIYALMTCLFLLIFSIVFSLLIAHEINTPIGISITSASFLIEKLQTLSYAVDSGGLTLTSFQEFLKESRECSDLILSSTQRAGSLIHSFKQLSVDSTSHDQKEIHVKPFLEKTLLPFRDVFQDKNITIHSHCSPSLSLYSDPFIIGDILQELIENSIVHGFSGKSQGDISITFSQDEIVFSDNGKGISADHLDQIFFPFFTSQRGGVKASTGLGLSKVHNLVSIALQGYIHCKSKVGEGGVFTIDFSVIS